MEDQDKVESNEPVRDEPVEVELEENVRVEPVKAESVKPKSVEDKKKVNKLAIFFGFLTLILAGVSIFFGVEYFKPKENKCENNCETSVVDDNDNWSNDGDEATKVESMAEQYKEVENVINNLTVGIGENWGYLENGKGLTYKPEGLNTFLTMKLDIVNEVIDENRTDLNAAEANMEILKTRFENAGFSSLGILPFLGSAGPEIYGYLDTSRNITCGMYWSAEYKTGGEVKYYYVSLECAKTDWLWLTEADKDLILELETAYYDKEGRYPSVIYNIRDIKNSQYEPYQTLMASVGGGVGLFYRTSSEERWRYFTGGQAAPDCNEYDTEDLKKAYAGEVCYNGTVQSTVQP